MEEWQRSSVFKAVGNKNVKLIKKITTYFFTFFHDWSEQHIHHTPTHNTLLRGAHHGKMTAVKLQGHCLTNALKVTLIENILEIVR